MGWYSSIRAAMTPKAVQVVATIVLGQSLSAAVALDLVRYSGIIMPAAWDAANLTFQVATALAGPYTNLYNSAGAEVVVTAAAGRTIMTENLPKWPYLIIRSGTAGTPVVQTAARQIVLVGITG